MPGSRRHTADDQVTDKTAINDVANTSRNRSGIGGDGGLSWVLWSRFPGELTVQQPPEAVMPRSYPPEFRRRVLDLVDSGRKVAEVAKLTGISDADHLCLARRHLIGTGQVPVSLPTSRPNSPWPASGSPSWRPSWPSTAGPPSCWARRPLPKAVRSHPRDGWPGSPSPHRRCHRSHQLLDPIGAWGVLSAMTWSGLQWGRPRPVRGSRMRSRRGRAQMLSWRRPGVRRIASGRPRPSHARWILVPAQ